MRAPAFVVRVIVITKLRWAIKGNRLRDIDDINGVLQVQGSNLDFLYLRQRAGLHGTLDLIERFVSEVSK